jgi:hypothetical protein
MYASAVKHYVLKTRNAFLIFFITSCLIPIEKYMILILVTALELKHGADI